MFERYTDKARRVLFFARYEANHYNAKVITGDHLLLGLLREGEPNSMAILQQLGINVRNLKNKLVVGASSDKALISSTEIPLSEEVKRILHWSVQESVALNHKHVGVEHILLGILRDDHARASQILAEMGGDIYSAKEILLEILKQDRLQQKKKEHPLLAEFSRNLSEMAERGAFDRLVGRQPEIQRIIQILSRRRKNNPILLGEPGVGKTSIVEGLAQQIIQGKVPIGLSEKKIYALDLSLVVAGTKYRGQFEERLKAIIQEAAKDSSVILFIDEIHSIIGTGAAEGSLDAANILKPALSRGEIQCIGSTTHREFTKYIEKDRALVRRFQSVHIIPPTEVEAMDVLQGLKDHYEAYHRVTFSQESLNAAVYLSNRYITDRSLPDKAIDLMDEAGAMVKLSATPDTSNIRELEKKLVQIMDEMNDAVDKKDFERAVILREYEAKLRNRIVKGRDQVNDDHEPLLVTAEDMQKVVSAWTGVPVTSLQEKDRNRLARMEEYLKKYIIGQDDAVSGVSRAIRRSRTGLKNPNRPMGSFLFLGPTGVGKTELSKQLAAFMFRDVKALVRFDMSEFMEKHSVSKMIGSPPGYVGFEEGGQLTDRIKRNPYSIVLFDEIEKAHPDLVNILLQIFEDGQVTDSFGNDIDFRNTIIIMTSNVGSKQIVSDKPLGLTGGSAKTIERDMKSEAMRELKRFFRPEFINRIDEIIVFNKLSNQNLHEISHLLVEELNQTLARNDLKVELESDVYQWFLDLTEKDRKYGARPLRRIIQRHIEDPLAEAIVQAEKPYKGLVLVSMKDGRLELKMHESGTDPSEKHKPEEIECSP